VTGFLHLSVREGMMLNPGTVADMQELEMIRLGLKRKEG
jgi:hypothetical protein